METESTGRATHSGFLGPKIRTVSAARAPMSAYVDLLQCTGSHLGFEVSSYGVMYYDLHRETVPMTRRQWTMTDVSGRNTSVTESV